MKYFFLTEGWVVGRVWGFGGLWNDLAWRRDPEIQQVNLCIQEQGERLWLYQVEEDVLMVEVKPTMVSAEPQAQSIGQVVLKRLMTAEQVINHLCQADVIQGDLPSRSATTTSTT